MRDSGGRVRWGYGVPHPILGELELPLDVAEVLLHDLDAVLVLIKLQPDDLELLLHALNLLVELAVLRISEGREVRTVIFLICGVENDQKGREDGQAEQLWEGKTPSRGATSEKPKDSHECHGIKAIARSAVCR